jgi:hypothetical protein
MHLSSIPVRISSRFALLHLTFSLFDNLKASN